MMNLRITLGISWILASLAMVGCGFHLRGEGIQGLPPIYIDGGDPRQGIRLAVERTLRGSGEKTATTRDQAHMVLYLSQENYRKWPLSISSQLLVQEYELMYSVAFRITDPDGKVLTPPQSVEFSRDYSFSGTAQVLGKENEEELLHKEMINDAARQILAQIIAVLEHEGEHKAGATQ